MNEQKLEQEETKHIVSAPNEVTMFGVDYDGAVSAGKDGWECDICWKWNQHYDYECRHCGGY